MHNMHQGAEIRISKYARICSTKYAENMHHIRSICTNEICKIYVYMLVYTKYCKSLICINMQIYIYAKKYAEICKTEYAKICISKI